MLRLVGRPLTLNGLVSRPYITCAISYTLSGTILFRFCDGLCLYLCADSSAFSMNLYY